MDNFPPPQYPHPMFAPTIDRHMEAKENLDAMTTTEQLLQDLRTMLQNVQGVEVLRVRPDDVVCVTLPKDAKHATVESCARVLERVLPHSVQSLVLEEGQTLQIVRKEKLPPLGAR